MFISILGYEGFGKEGENPLSVPECFLDLNLDQILDVILESRKEYNLEKYFYRLLDRKQDIVYRQEITKDLCNQNLFNGMLSFTRMMNQVHELERYYLESDHEWQKKRWYLDFCVAYCQAITDLKKLLVQNETHSKGFHLLKEWLDEYSESTAFVTLNIKSEQLLREFDTIRYSLQMEQDKVIVNRTLVEGDYCERIQNIFGSDVEAVSMNNPLIGATEMPDIEHEILKILKKSNKKIFGDLSDFFSAKLAVLDETVVTFENEIQFYLSYLSFMKQLQEKGFECTCPEVGEGKFEIQGVFDIALAWKNFSEGKEVVCNDLYYGEKEQFLVVTGQNQGGKTTFARAVGQVLYFTGIGLTAPCSYAKIPLFTNLLTHFSVEESLQTGRGKLKEELVRLKPMMQKEMEGCFVILNELFTTAASHDAYIMGRRVMEHFMNGHCRGIYVTHIQELAKEDESIASMTAIIDKEDENRRTFLIERKVAGGIGHVNSLVLKHRLRYLDVKEVLGR